jgi:hypothetical protein
LSRLVPAQGSRGDNAKTGLYSPLPIPSSM